MKTTNPLLKKSLTVFAAFALTATISYGALTSPKGLYKSTPYMSIDTTNDSKLAAINGATAALDSIVAKVKAKADSIFTSGGVNAYNSYITNYLSAVDSIESSLTSDPDYKDTYSLIFKYIYPRVYAMKKSTTGVFDKLNSAIDSSSTSTSTTTTGVTTTGTTTTSSTTAVLPTGLSFTSMGPGGFVSVLVDAGSQKGKYIYELQGMTRFTTTKYPGNLITSTTDVCKEEYGSKWAIMNDSSNIAMIFNRITMDIWNTSSTNTSLIYNCQNWTNASNNYKGLQFDGTSAGKSNSCDKTAYVACTNYAGMQMKFTTPVVTPSCASTEHLENNVCVSNTKICSIANGQGSQLWNGQGYNDCTPTNCNSGYSVSGGACNPVISTISVQTSSFSRVVEYYLCGNKEKDTAGNIKGLRLTASYTRAQWTPDYRPIGLGTYTDDYGRVYASSTSPEYPPCSTWCQSASYNTFCGPTKLIQSTEDSKVELPTNVITLEVSNTNIKAGGESVSLYGYIPSGHTCYMSYSVMNGGGSSPVTGVVTGQFLVNAGSNIKITCDGIPKEFKFTEY